MLLLDLGVFFVGSGSGWTKFFHLFFCALVTAIDLVLDLDPAFLWLGGMIWKNGHIRGKLYI